MKFRPGQDVIIEFDETMLRGEILSQTGDWVMASVWMDMAADYGGLTERVAPRSTVCVKSSMVTVI
jgi:hypothetical protein